MSGTTARTRLAPDQRRAQLLDLGVQLLSARSLDELSIDMLAEEAGVSRGLLYHYFGSKSEFHLAVVQRAADELIAQTAPPEGGDPLTRLRASMAGYVAYVWDNRAGYESLVRAAAGNDDLRRVRAEVRGVMIDRVFEEDAQAALLVDNVATRLVVSGWAAMVEDVVLAWVAQPDAVTRDQIVALVTDALPALVLTVAD